MLPYFISANLEFSTGPSACCMGPKILCANQVSLLVLDIGHGQSFVQLSSSCWIVFGQGFRFSSSIRSVIALRIAKVLRNALALHHFATVPKKFSQTVPTFRLQTIFQHVAICVFTFPVLVQARCPCFTPHIDDRNCCNFSSIDNIETVPPKNLMTSGQRSNWLNNGNSFLAFSTSCQIQ